MREFKKILVGVDLSVGDRLAGEELAPPTTEAVQRALWLAKLNSAHLQFFYALDIGYQAQLLIQENRDVEANVLDRATQVLVRLVDRATRQGIAADHVVTFGKSWVEIIRQVLRDHRDLVIVGAKDPGVVERLFIGTTGMKLLRKCPCPVWVTHPPRSGAHGVILVGHDLTAVGDHALQLGASLSELYRAPLHVVHAIEPMFVDALEPLAASAAVEAEARQTAEDRIAAQLRHFQLVPDAEVHVATGVPATVLLEHIERYNAQLLVMGTIARSGIEGLLFGNTAELLLPHSSCSVLAVKPAGFRSPITLG